MKIFIEGIEYTLTCTREDRMKSTSTCNTEGNIKINYDKIDELNSINNRRVQLCPVCHGRGFVSHGFYSDFSSFTSTDTTPVQCRSCCGCGYVVI